jgi:hypothetical protein
MHASRRRLLRCFGHWLLIQLHLTNELPQGIHVSLADEQHNSSLNHCIAKRYLSPLLKSVICELERSTVLGHRTHNMLWRSFWQLGMNLHCDLDSSAEQAI